jgi:hypothetical protein
VRFHKRYVSVNAVPPTLGWAAFLRRVPCHPRTNRLIAAQRLRSFLGEERAPAALGVPSRCA